MTFVAAAKQDALGRRAPDAGAMVRGRARRHSAFVRLLRWLAPAAIFAIIGMLGGFAVLDAMRTAAARPREMPTEIRMVRPHFLGRDDKGRDFNLTATQAHRDDHDMQQVLLTEPVMVMTVTGQGPRTLTADNGIYREDTRILRLIGHVRLDDARSSKVSTDEAVVDTRAGTVRGLSPVAGAGPSGDVEAKSYDVADKGNRIILHGGVHARLNGGASGGGIGWNMGQ